MHGPRHVTGEIVVCISGASGAIYGIRLLECLVDAGRSVRLVATDSARLTLKHECDTTPEAITERLVVVSRSLACP